MDRGAWQSILHSITKELDTTERLSHTHPNGSVVKEYICNAEDEGHTGLIPGQEDPLDEEMVIHSNILAWKIPWTEEPGSL